MHAARVRTESSTWGQGRGIALHDKSVQQRCTWFVLSAVCVWYVRV